MESKWGGRREVLKGNFLLLVASSFLFTMSGYLMVPMLPTYLGGIGVPEFQVGFVLGMFNLAAVFSRIPVGTYIDRRGRRVMLMLGILLQLASPFLYTLCAEAPQFMVVRAMNGLGFAAYTVTAQTMVVDASPRGRLGEVLGLYAVSMLMAQVVGPSLSGLVLGGFGYTATFYVSGLLGLAAAAMAMRISIPPRTPAPVGTGGFRALLRNRNLSTASFALAMLTIPHGVVLSFLPLHMAHLGVSPEGIGLYFTVYAICMGGIRPFTGALSDRIGRVAVAVPFALLSALGVAGFGLADSLPWFLAAGAFFGTGMGAAHATLSALAVDTVHPKQRGKAVSVSQTATEAGISAGAFGMGPVVLGGGFPVAFGSAAALVAGGTVAFLGVRAAWKKEEVVYT